MSSFKIIKKICFFLTQKRKEGLDETSCDHRSSLDQSAREQLPPSPSSIHSECGRVEEDLPVQENQFQAIFERALDAMVIVDGNGRYTEVNLAACELLGRSPAGLIGRLLSDFVEPGFNFEPAWQSSQEQGRTGELRLLRSEGTIQSIEYSAIADLAANRYLLILRDITARKSTKTELKPSCNQLEEMDELALRNRELLTLHRISEIHISTQSLKATFQEIVEEISSATGFPIIAIELYDAARQMMIFAGVKGIPLLSQDSTLEVPVDQTLSGTVARTGQPIIKTYAPQESKKCAANETLSQLGIKTFICLPMTVNQQVIGVLSLAHPEIVQYDDYGLRWLASLANYVASLTDRKRAEEALRASEEQFRQMAENIHEVFWMANLDLTQILYVSPAYEEVYGRTCESLYRNPQSWGEAIHPEDRDRMLTLIPQLNQHELREEEYRIVRPDGSIRWIRDRAFPVRDQTGQVYRMVGVARDITAHKHTEIALRQRVERERLITAIAQHIRQSLNLEEILNTTVAEVRQFLQTDRVIIFRFESDWSGVVAVESVAEGYTSILDTHIYEPCFKESYVQLYKRGRTKATEDVYTAGLDPCHLDLLVQLQVRANLVVPILQGQQLWGLLIAHHCSAPRQWQQLETDLLQQLANQVAIAIQQSELYQQVQQLNTDLEQQVQYRIGQLQRVLEFEAMLKRITDKVRDSLDESQILQTVVQELAEVLEVAGCDTARYNLEQATSTILYEHAVSMPAVQGRIVHMVDYAEIYRQLLKGQYLHFCHTTADPIRPERTQFVILACPIFVDQAGPDGTVQEVLGDLWLFKQSQTAFEDLEVRLVQQVANQCAIAIRQARLYQTAQTQVAELETLNHLKDDFLSTISHELRTPVSNMKMAIQMLELTLNRQIPSSSTTTVPKIDTNKTARYLQILHDECEREITLVNDLLDLQRLEGKTQSLSLSAIELSLWLPQIMRPFIERTQNRQQKLRIDVAEQLPLLVTDSDSLERILAELLNNACKYTPPGETIMVTAQAQVASTANMTREVIQFQVKNFGVEIPQSELSQIFEKFYRVPHADPWKQGGTGLGLALVQKLCEHLQGKILVESGSSQTCFTVELPLNLSN